MTAVVYPARLPLWEWLQSHLLRVAFYKPWLNNIIKYHYWIWASLLYKLYRDVGSSTRDQPRLWLTYEKLLHHICWPSCPSYRALSLARHRLWDLIGQNVPHEDGLLCDWLDVWKPLQSWVVIYCDPVSVISAGLKHSQLFTVRNRNFPQDENFKPINLEHPSSVQ